MQKQQTIQLSTTLPVAQDRCCSRWLTQQPRKSRSMGKRKIPRRQALARMNMILHNNPTALNMQGNTLADPRFRDGETLKTFDYVVANPPFSDKRWSTGLGPLNDPYQRFQPFATPPSKQGDYANLLDIARSLRSTATGPVRTPLARPLWPLPAAWAELRVLFS